MIKQYCRHWLYPGINLHARQRYRILPDYFGASGGEGTHLVLDAGCGNGMLSYQSYRKGNMVIGVTIKDGEVARCRRYFNGFLGIPDNILSFRKMDLLELASLGLAFDEIICSEVLEHIIDDRAICDIFSRIIKPGGILHV
jgi:2-polyprenyl-3-methyl-5-hydroxy-6-metoxy-1,4-benzoquinol methylase